MSMPSSSELVATTQRKRPDLRSSSMVARWSFDTEPWCARASSLLASFRPMPISDSFLSSYISFSRAVRRSASRREFANTIVERCSRMRSTICSSTCGQIDPCAGDDPLAADPSRTGAVPSSVMSSTGTTTLRSNFLVEGGATIVTGDRPPRNRATSACGRTVADRPIRCAGFFSNASSRSSERARCAPRLVEATACTSSTMTVSTFRSVSRADAVSIR